MNKNLLTLTKEDYKSAFGEKLSLLVEKTISENPVTYQKVTQKEKEKIIIGILDHLNDSFVVRAGPERIDAWNKGWNENFELILENNDLNALIPKYFGKYKHIRFNGEFIKTENKNAEYNSVKVLQTWLFEKLLSNVENIYEFGCGTGHNLVRASNINKNANIIGLDWSVSPKGIFEKINTNFGKDFSFSRFNFFDIDRKFKIKKNSGVYTFAALEQSGKNFKDFIDYLVDNKPSVCIHIEPIAELLDSKNNLNDFLSVEYFKKRNYLLGLQKYLKKLEKEGIIEIIMEKRSNIGSLYIEGYSIIAWRLKNA